MDPGRLPSDCAVFDIIAARRTEFMDAAAARRLEDDRPRRHDQASTPIADGVLEGGGMSEERYMLASGGMEATIKAHGAELCSLRSPQDV
jgi:hypothetical protein